MSELILHTVHDLRMGRESWRVMLLLCASGLFIGFAIGMVPLS